MIKKTVVAAVTRADKPAVKSQNILNQQLIEELHKPVIKKFEKRKLHSSFKDNISGADLAYMQLISKLNKRIHSLLCVIDIFSKHA